MTYFIPFVDVLAGLLFLIHAFLLAMEFLGYVGAIRHRAEINPTGCWLLLLATSWLVARVAPGLWS